MHLFGFFPLDYDINTIGKKYFININKDDYDEDQNESSPFYLDNFTLSKDDILKSRITSFLKLKNNWDGQGAIVPKPETISNSIGILEDLSISSIYHLDEEDIHLTPYGTVVIDWEFDNDNILSLEIGYNSMGYFYEKDGKTTQKKDKPIYDSKSFINATSSIQKDLSLFI